MNKVMEQLQRKLGPLRVWQWGLVASGGIWLLRSLYGQPSRPTASRTVGGAEGSSALPASAPPPVESRQPLAYGDASGLFVSGEGSDVLSLLSLYAQRWQSAPAPAPSALVPSSTVPAPAYTVAPSTPLASLSPVTVQQWDYQVGDQRCVGNVYVSGIGMVGKVFDSLAACQAAGATNCQCTTLS